MASSSEPNSPGSPFASHESDLMNMDLESETNLPGAPVIKGAAPLGQTYAKMKGQLGDLSAISEDESDSSWQQVQDANAGTMRPFVRAPGLLSSSSSSTLLPSPQSLAIQSHVQRVVAEQRIINAAGLPVVQTMTQEQRIDVGSVDFEDLFAQPMQVDGTSSAAVGAAQPPLPGTADESSNAFVTTIQCTSRSHGGPT